MLYPVYDSFDELKKKFDQMSLYRYLFRVFLKRDIPAIEEMVMSPFRHEQNASFKFFVSKYGEIAWVDHGLGAQKRYGYDALGFYRAYRALVVKRPATYHQALGFLAHICHSNKLPPPDEKFIEEMKEKPKANMYASFQKSLGEHAEFWHKHGVTDEILRKYQVFLAREVYVDGTKVAKTTDKNPVFLYLFSDLNSNSDEPSWQSYQPKKKKFRFFSHNINLMGYNQLPETGKNLILTSSYKDVLVLASQGYPAISTGSEKTLQSIPDSILEELQQRFQNVYLMLDNDKTGRECTAAMLEDHPWIKNIHIPDDYPKDPADIVLEDPEKLKQLLPAK